MLATFVIPWSIWACFWWTRPLRGGLVAALITAAWGVVMTRVLGCSFDALLFGIAPAVVLTVHLTTLQAAGFRLTKDEVDYLEDSEAME